MILGESWASIKNVFGEMFTVSRTVSKTRVITHIKRQYYLLSGLTKSHDTTTGSVYQKNRRK